MKNEHKIVCGILGLQFYGLNVLGEKNELVVRKAIDSRR